MIFRKMNRIMQQKPAIFTLIYKAGNKYAGGERHEKKDHHCGCYHSVYHCRVSVVLAGNTRPEEIL